MQVPSNTGALMRTAAAHADAVIAPARGAPPAGALPKVSLERAPFDAEAAAAIAELGPGPLQLTGSVRDALRAGRLLRTGDDTALDALEDVLRSGAIDRPSSLRVGGGMNGDRFRMRLEAPGSLTPDRHVWAVEKPAEAQAAQEELAWRVGRELRIDHLLPAAVRRSDGTAWIRFHNGTGLSQAGVTDLTRLDQALTASYLEDASLGLTRTEAAQAARIDRQLLQLLDYVLANNDRHLGNGLLDAAGGRNALTFLDYGHAGRGTTAAGATELAPALRLFQGTSSGGRVDLDAEVVAHAQRRLTPDRVRELHAAVYEAPDMAKPAMGSYGARFQALTSTGRYREGIIRRLEHAAAERGYTHMAYAGDNAGELPPMQSMRNVRGFNNVRGAMHGGMGGRF